MLNKKKSTDNNLNGIDTTLGNQNTTSKDSTNEYGDLNGINFKIVIRRLQIVQQILVCNYKINAK